MPEMTTVCGRRSAEAVGLADAHAHLWIAPGVHGAPVLNDEAMALAEIADFATVGGSLLIDCQPGTCGRDGRILARLSRSTGVMIVAATGFHLARYYAEGAGPWALDADAAFELFVRELSHGLEEAPDVRAGVVKTAWTGQGGHEKGLMGAALAAAGEAHCGVVVHTEAGRAVEGLVRLVEDCRFAPHRVQFSHIDKRSDHALHHDLAAAGYLLGYDTFLRPKYHPECGVWPLLHDLIAAGFSRQITLGLDLVDSVSWYTRGGPGLRWLGTEAAARLGRDGVDDTSIRALLGGNVARLLGGNHDQPEG